MSEQTSPPQLLLLPSPDWKDYALVDSGGGQRLEKYGPYLLVRPEPEAVWKPALSASEWQAAQARFIPSPEENGGHWEWLKPGPERWEMQYKDLRFWVSLGASRHTGLFPEQAVQWDWSRQQIRTAGRPLSVLNLFGYTGLASLAAARAGAKVTHLDASRKVVTWARDNQALSGLESAPIRWIIDDALKFVHREARRGAGYDGIILDPPKFGRGPKGEIWEFYKLIPELLEACREAFGSQPRFLLLTAYAVKASAVTLYHAVEEMMQSWKGRTEAGEVVLVDQSAGRSLSTAIFARWSSAEGEKNHE
jgi:23S rRNA (cytosine1962-C5)-methyltransferase